MSQLIIVSNRLPVTIEKKDNTFHYTKSVGGLATGVGSVYQDYEGYWVGWSGLSLESVSEEETVQINDHLKQDYSNVPLFLSRKQVNQFYQGFCNKTIWPLFHYFPQFTEYNKNTWLSYKEVNRIFCDKVLEVADEDDIIWVHDYHLFLLPQMIRKRLPKARIGFFLHIPFPSSEIFRLLPWGREILQGFLGADLIGFHTYDYVRHFTMSIRLMLGIENTLNRISLENRVIKVDVFPMGIDYKHYAEAINQPDVNQEADRIQDKVGDCRIILSVDRMDYSKGLPERLEAYDEFLERYPEFIEKVILILVAVPSRTNVTTYVALRERVDKLIGRINGKYGKIGWNPVWYLYRSLNFPTLTALYYLSEVALVTPLRDGMNLVAKEYLATKTHAKHKGVMVLSEMAGAAKELGEALTVNPNDTEEIADMLYKALNMPIAEVNHRSEIMQQRLQRYDIIRWARDFIDRLQQTRQLQEDLFSKRVNDSIINRILEDFQRSQHRLILLDYDGTLRPFTEHPDQAIPTEDIHEILDSLSRMPNTDVVVISGRKKENLEEWFGKRNNCLIAEHGVWIKSPGSEWQTLEPMRSEWKEDIRPMLEVFVDRTPGSLVEEKDYSLVWHFRKADSNLASIRSRELKEALYDLISNLNLGVMEGNKVIEIKNAGINKGSAVAHWIHSHDYDFILAFGDDVTDEDMFQVLPDFAYSIKVRLEATTALYKVESVSEVHDLLRKLVEKG